MKVSPKAVIGRINRLLAKKEWKFHKTRRWDSDARHYYIQSWRNEFIKGYDSLEQAARELGALEKYEFIAE